MNADERLLEAIADKVVAETRAESLELILRQLITNAKNVRDTHRKTYGYNVPGNLIRAARATLRQIDKDRQEGRQ